MSYGFGVNIFPILVASQRSNEVSTYILERKNDLNFLPVLNSLNLFPL